MWLLRLKHKTLCQSMHVAASSSAPGQQMRVQLQCVQR